MPPILIVDDNAEARDCLTMLLELHGMTNVAGAHSGEEALERLNRDRFGVIICDFHLGGMNGLEFVSQFRARGDNTPVLLVTGSDDESIRNEAAGHAQVEFFAKPFTFGQLGERIQQLLAA